MDNVRIMDYGLRNKENVKRRINFCLKIYETQQSCSRMLWGINRFSHHNVWVDFNARWWESLQPLLAHRLPWVFQRQPLPLEDACGVGKLTNDENEGCCHI